MSIKFCVEIGRPKKPADQPAISERSGQLLSGRAGASYLRAEFMFQHSPLTRYTNGLQWTEMEWTGLEWSRSGRSRAARGGGRANMGWPATPGRRCIAFDEWDRDFDAEISDITTSGRTCARTTIGLAGRRMRWPADMAMNPQRLFVWPMRDADRSVAGAASCRPSFNETQKCCSTESRQTLVESLRAREADVEEGGAESVGASEQRSDFCVGRRWVRALAPQLRNRQPLGLKSDTASRSGGGREFARSTDTSIRPTPVSVTTDSADRRLRD